MSRLSKDRACGHSKAVIRGLDSVLSYLGSQRRFCYFIFHFTNFLKIN